MKIAIVSDTHNNWANFKKAIEWIKKEKIQLIFHCGDISSQETIDDARKLFENDIKFVKGNADYDMPDLPDFMELEIENKKVTFAHFPAEAKKMAQSGKYDMVFYGHTHKACLARRSLGEGGGGKSKECLLVNPGELAGQFYKPTFAVYDTATGELSLKILEML
ncbi:MAG: hypothetical protein A2528_01330 [Candidatus Staskawiczbacteria bacterium RIFOXYD2_FULL_37_9]|uniref:Phosphoesterase n=1 Tax=Candidatus Staskawiczbacteria bacterium RIFOXYB1_FULL_37_44 TaxID=1802223 RepID=A0A1G2IW14_9BACT|nr:MAG: hypothetical protein A2358_01880 [Candidatus Staskawiczbacteria bacterium RIFOXYB1_FULL_37_44]OGZ83270.1 MAG: hypothetical protein A2416_00455 [Candidatus Staskawiczbacteria bacterium RIFOXYC1_FULL_37_52]OGZ87870.1 MAG: hypothetical protein A2444_03470 [Candidatus Staskawiczbacteria bacterium RIFOXYC2_FULL_37_19]OGZ89328.1 MAG: hypothetical protein A2581_00400 [Candidatus Staskawiczbacteria bacterium RIFOXYD1_FULL_37_110]OGZ94575.1 MAG: hypothetical protein A2528_01330 [Candidatus Stask